MRENTGQNNSKYGHLLRNVYIIWKITVIFSISLFNINIVVSARNTKYLMQKSDKCFFHVVHHFFVGWKLVQFLLSLSHRPSLAEMWAAIHGKVNLLLSFVFRKLTSENILSHATLETGNDKSLFARVEINENSSLLSCQLKPRIQLLKIFHHCLLIFSDTWILSIRYCPWKKRPRGDYCFKILLTQFQNSMLWCVCEILGLF